MSYQHDDGHASANLPALDARSIAHALGGDVVGRDQVAAPGPGHSRRDRSLSIRLSASAPDGFMVNSHAGDDWRDCRDHVKQALGIPTGMASSPQPTTPKFTFANPAEDDSSRIAAPLERGRRPHRNVGRDISPLKAPRARRRRRGPALASAPAGNARIAVRGLAASSLASTRRLNAIAADRAVTIHTTIHPSTRKAGHPSAASTAPVSANGSANIECSHLIISSVMAVLFHNEVILLS